MKTARERYDERKEQLLGEYNHFPNSLLVPLLRFVRQDADVALSITECFYELERIEEVVGRSSEGMASEADEDLLTAMEEQDPGRWERLSWVGGLRGEELGALYIYEQEREGQMRVVWRMVDTDNDNIKAAIKIQYLPYDQTNDRRTLMVERGFYFLDVGFKPQGDDEVLGLPSFLRTGTKIAKAARERVEKIQKGV